MKKEDKKTRVAAIADIHFKVSEKEEWLTFFRNVSKEVDVLAISGDLTDRGTEKEAKALSEALQACSIPVVAVLGNHDHEAGYPEELMQTLSSEKVHILDGDSVIINNIGFAGVKGFGGGFDQFTLPLWGERMNKLYVEETVNETLKLDRALAGLDSKHVSDLKKIVLLHYAPVVETLIGEPEQIFPFLGSSRLSEPINGRDVVAVFHGHAHWGSLKGKTTNKVKVYNVALPVLKREGYENFFLLEI